MSSGHLRHQGTRLPQSHHASLRLRAAALPALLALTTLISAQQPLATHQARSKQFLQRRPALNPAASLLKARAQSALLPHAATTNLTAAWQPLGPNAVTSPTFGNLTGRITALAADPNDATGNTLYLGTTGGGVWKSTNAASSLASVTFSPLTDAQASLSVGALAVQPAANPVVLAGTGDSNDATDSYYGEGVLRSTNGGTTWTLVSSSHDGVNGNHSFAGLATAGIAFSTATPTLVVAAFSTSPQASVVSATNTTSVPGLYYSTDAGATWQMATLYDGATIVQQPLPLGSVQPGNAATSVVWNAQRQRFYAAVRSHGYYSSADGVTWTRLTAQPGSALTAANCPVGTNGVGSSSCPIFRGTLAVQPATGDLYALTVDANDNDQGLWQDLCSATSNTCATPAPVFSNRIDNGALDTNTFTVTQGTYNLALAAAPAASNGTLLFVGTVDLYRCGLAAGSSACALRDTTNALNGCNAPAAVAPDQHALAAVAQSTGTPVLYLGNDGGLWRSLDAVAETGPVCAATDKSHFDNLNTSFTGSIAEVVAFAQHPTDPDTILAGLGTNGSAATTTASTLGAWQQFSAGEGGYPQLDPNTPSNWFLSIGAGVDLSACTLGASCTAANFVPPATIGAAQVSYDASLLDAPSLLDPSLTTDLLTATCRVWRGPAATGATWSSANALSPAFDGSATPCTASSPLVRSLAAGGPAKTSTTAQLSGSSVLYAGLAGALDGGSSLGGHLFVTTTANTAPAWTDTALSPVTNDTANTHLFNPVAFDISSIAADTHDPTGATVYATVMGFGYPHLYRSTDFGAHWLNISANLPDAPANAVLIDPNSANTVYVALDTGVYVTQAVTTCATTNCWSLLGTGLPNSPVVALEAAANMPTGTGLNGMLRAATYGRGIWATPLLTAAAPQQPAASLSAPSLTFAAQQVSTQSSAQTVTVTSSGTSTLTISSVALTGDYAETDTCTGQTLAVGSACTIAVTFTPTATGTRPGLLTVYANIPTGQATVSLTGTGTAAASVVFTPTSLTFAATTVNQSDPSQIVTVANTGGSVATLQTPAVTGANAADFAITANTCTATLAASTACSIQITFTPSAAGTRSATLTLTDSAGTQTASLTGTGSSPATDTLSTTALTFAQQQLNTTSPAQQVTLTNSGGVALTLIAASVSPNSDFAVTNACGNSLAANSTCAFTVTFTPTATGARTATLTVSDQFRTQTVALTGTGVAPPGVSLAPATLTFPATGVTLPAPAQTLTLTNNGGLPLTISSTAISPSFAVASTTCGSTLAVNTACNYIIVFVPAAAGAITGTLTLTTNAPTPLQTISLSGTGIDFALTATSSTSATLTTGTNGGTATYTLQISSLGTLSGNIALACAGAPANSTCTIAPPTASLGVTTPLVVTLATGTTVAQTSRTPAGIYLALIAPLVLLFRRKHRRSCRLALLLIALTGCAAGRLVPPATTTPVNYLPTPAGTYNLTVSATAAGLTRTVPLTLTIQ
jgi:hypothetical protein